jgi:hypothetical protein
MKLQLLNFFKISSEMMNELDFMMFMILIILFKIFIFQRIKEIILIHLAF